MIVDTPNKDHNMPHNNTNAVPLDSPPSYDYATEGSSSPIYTADAQQPKTSSPLAGPSTKRSSNDGMAQPLIPHPLPPQMPSMSIGIVPTYLPQGGGGGLYGTPTPQVYNYINPRTGEQVVSLLPPNHPEMICLQAGEHVPHTQYGLLGILAAIFWFPLGVGLCLLDKRVRCTRCGQVIEDGICG
ncbi:hypothetical protein D9613_000184 [Agrocybe pediades]|uniref:Brain protein I3 n=1 Tax=Agrocybe pediades TaxID=84607 RepID=A0A8H4R260_9AGAR|nr:hypothetical protein D9613_000184 [Agrocybe pediades]